MYGVDSPAWEEGDLREIKAMWSNLEFSEVVQDPQGRRES